MKARPIGIGHAAPAAVITNKDMEKIVETTDVSERMRRRGSEGEGRREGSCEGGGEIAERRWDGGIGWA
eukprot:768609-Hanusia_phi.AAC.2